MPSPGLRAAAELISDPARSDRLIAEAARCDHATVHQLRRELEAAALIRPVPRALRAARTPPPRTPGKARLAIAALGLRATAAQVAARAGVSYQAGWQALRAASTQPPLPGRACGPQMHNDPPYPVGWPSESAAAVRVCTTYCPVYARCATWALTQPHTPGVLGGLTSEQRRRAVALPV